jgi:hypothetical protein
VGGAVAPELDIEESVASANGCPSRGRVETTLETREMTNRECPVWAGERRIGTETEEDVAALDVSARGKEPERRGLVPVPDINAPGKR